MNFGEKDGGSPVQKVREGVKTIAQAFQEAAAPQQFSHWIEEGAGHVLSEQMWRRTRDCFQQHLCDV